jgi:signal transduction histidine kinase
LASESPPVGRFDQTEPHWCSEEYIGHNISEFHADAPVLEDILNRLFRGDRIKEYEARLRAKDGSLRHVIIDSSALFEGGKFVHTRCFTRDISERKQAEDLLRRSEERFRALVNASSDVAYHMNPDWSEMRQLDGRGFIADTGKPRKDWLNEYIDVADQPLVLKSIREALRTKSMFELEHRVRRTDGTLGWTYSRAVPLLDPNGAIVEWFGAASDVTARREAEERYRKLAQTLDAEVRARTRELEEQSNQVRELSWRLLRSQDDERRHIARELHDSAGQTLTVLGINLAQLAQKAARNAPEVATEAEKIQETVQQLHREIRTTSYLLHPPLLDETGLYSAINWYVQGLQERSRVELRFDCSETFGRLPPEMELVIFRLVQECLTNIHRHSASKAASIRLSRESSQITLEIRDQGKGMSRERLAEIQSGRSGVGITGMRERLRQFAGTLAIESGDSGTCVFATIPVPKDATPDDQSVKEPLQASAVL